MPAQLSNSNTTGNGIAYHGGPIMDVTGSTPVHFYYIWYGNWSSLDPSAVPLLTTFAQNIGGSPYYNINTTYFNSSNQNLINAVSYGGSVNDNYSQGTTLGDFGSTSVEAVVLSHVGHDLPVDPNGVYFVLTTPDVNESSGFCNVYCGWHTYTTSGSTNIKFAFIGDPLRCPSACEAQSPGPNGSGGGDGMASVIAHEGEESLTDPLISAWYNLVNGGAEENADLCVWTFGSALSTAGNGAAYNVTLGGTNFLIQQNWLNANGGSCVMSWVATSDFTLSPTPSSQTVNPGSTANYTINVGATNGFTGNVSLSVSSTLPAGVQANFVPNPVAAPNGATLSLTTTQGTTPAGSYSLTITGISGSLTHTTTVTLNVADFGISVSPSSQSVGSNTNASYTVTITALNGFTGNVSLNATGLPSGANLVGFNPVTVTGGHGTSTLTINSGTSTGGTFTITGQGPATTHTTSASFKVQASDFTISASPSSFQIRNGQNGTAKITVAPVSGFTGAVTLAASGLPTGMTASFSPNPISGGSGSSTLTVSANGVSTGNHTITVTGTSGTLTHTANVTVNIKH